MAYNCTLQVLFNAMSLTKGVGVSTNSDHLLHNNNNNGYFF